MTAGGRRVGGPAAAMKIAPAAIEHPDADAGAAAASEPEGIAGEVGRQVVEPADCGRDRQRELRSGAEADMRRNRLLDVYRVRAAQPQMPPHRVEMLFHARAL